MTERRAEYLAGEEGKEEEPEPVFNADHLAEINATIQRIRTDYGGHGRLIVEFCKGQVRFIGLGEALRQFPLDKKNG